MNRKVQLLGPLLLLAVVLFPLIFPVLEPIWPQCPLRQKTGLQCPGCGGTRSLLALGNFRFLEALRSNAFVSLGIVFFVIGCVFPQIRSLLSPHFWWGVLVLIVLFTIVRNF